MDALKLLKEEAARKRKAISENNVKVSLPQCVESGQGCCAEIVLVRINWNTHYIFAPQGRKYVKRSELERISRGLDEDKNSGDEADTKSSKPQSSGGEGAGKSHLLSPTSIVAPPEMKAAIFSIPRSEVCPSDSVVCI